MERKQVVEMYRNLAITTDFKLNKMKCINEVS